MKNHSVLRLSFMLMAGVSLLLGYNNCGKGKTADSLSSGGIIIPSSTYDEATVCQEQDINVFDRGYHQFLEYTCKTCHVSGPGKGTFASPDLDSAFSAFTSIGYDLISNHAISDSHKPPYTGPQNIQIINQLRSQWESYRSLKQSCNGGTPTVPVNTSFAANFETTTQAIPVLTSRVVPTRVNGETVNLTVYDRKVLTWDLSKTLTPTSSVTLPDLAGVSFSITVTGYLTASGETAYLFTLPTLKVGSKSIHVKGLNFRLNGFPISYATTFKTMDSNVYQGLTSLLAPGSLVSVGALGANDTLAIQLQDISNVNIPAPPPPPQIQFRVAAMTIQKTQLGYANKVAVQIDLTGENTEAISVGIEAGVAADYPASEKMALDVLANGKNRFDWDYKVDPLTPLSINFTPGQKSASFNLIFSDDLRNDVTKTVRMKVANVLGGVAGANKTLVITLPNYNTAYTGSAPTFALLMNPNSGILGKNCTKCHNSTTRAGNYDMSDYQEMVDRGVIMPGDPIGDHSKMFLRMNADAPNQAGLQSMPLDGFLPDDQIDLVRQWISAGALNN